MGLITTEVLIKWTKKSEMHYKSKGYIFTKYFEEFVAQVEDLQDGCSAKVKIKCDNCDIEKEWIYKDFKVQVKEDGKCYCIDCARKLYSGKNLQKSLLKKSKSLEQWCIENNRQDILDRWDYELNNCKPSEVTYGSDKWYYLKCTRGIHKSELKHIKKLTSNNQEGSIMCNKCNSYAQWGIDNLGKDFLEKYWNYEKNIDINPWELNHGSNKKVWIKCLEIKYHDSYEVSCHDFSQGVRCSYCGTTGKVHIMDSLGVICPEVLDIWSDKNDKSPFEYSSNSAFEVYWKCSNNKHDDYIRSIVTSVILNFRCPSCVRERTESFLQEKVRLYLESLNYIILHENQCTVVPKNPKTKYNLPFDNEIFDLKLIIEVNGIQHYELCNFHTLSAKQNNTTPEQELHYQQIKDRYKRMFAKKQGYFYLEIPYWTDDKNETWKKLIDDKINKIIY